MKRPYTNSLHILSCVTLLSTLGSTTVLAGTARNTNLAELDTIEAAGLTYMREEEKLARDVYQNFYPLWNNPKKIISATETHGKTRKNTDKIISFTPAPPSPARG